MGNRPGAQLAYRPLHFIWIVGCSSSMAANGKIQALNNSIREAIPHLQQVADDNPNANVLVRAIKFSSGAQWHITEPTPVTEFKWTDLTADGARDMGKALLMVAEQLKIPPMTERGLPPVLILITDGPPTDDISRGLQAVMDQPWGKKAVRLAVAIGEDADLDVLQKFIGHSEIKPLQANNPEALTRYVKWQSTAVLKSVSKPVSTFKGEFAMSKRPGGELASRPLHFIWIADCSGSMVANGKIQALNNAIREAIPHMQQVADDNPNANVLVRAIKFSSGAQWHILPTPVAEFKWTDLTADGVTDMGKAFSMVAEQLKIPPMTERGLPPVLILISDGQPTDDISKGLQAIMEQQWGKKAVRLAIAIGEDAEHDVLQKFIGHSEIKPLQANNPEALTRYVKWASTAVLKSASSPAIQSNKSSSTSSPIPVPIPVDTGSPTTQKDIW